jgi:antitoxin HicB
MEYRDSPERSLKEGPSKKISKVRMAALLKTSRTQVARLLDSKNDITLSSLQRAAASVGRRVSIELV